MNHPTRRDVLKWSAAIAGTGLLGRSALAVDEPKKKILFFTKSSGFQHDVINRNGKPLAYAEQILIDLGAAHGFDVTASKDGSLFTPEKLADFDAVVFYTTGDLTTAGTDKQPPMPENGRQNLIDYVEGGKGLIGLHCASDTFHSKKGEIDPYIKLLGGEFVTHGPKQIPSTCQAVEPTFPGSPAKDFTMTEEWYSLHNFATDMDVILVQQTAGMGAPYERKNYPCTWCRTQGKGRVFYTSMGHREDVWKNPIFTDLLVGAMTFATGGSKYEPKGNLKQVAPDAGD